MFTAYSNNYYNFKKSKALLVTFWRRLIGIPRECSDFADSGWRFEGIFVNNLPILVFTGRFT